MFELNKYSIEMILSALKISLVNFARYSLETVFNHKQSLDHYAHKDAGSLRKLKHHGDWRASW